MVIAMLLERVGRYPGLRRANSTKVVGNYCGPDVRLEVVKPAPGAASSAIGALEAGDAGTRTIPSENSNRASGSRHSALTSIVLP